MISSNALQLIEDRIIYGLVATVLATVNIWSCGGNDSLGADIQHYGGMNYGVFIIPKMSYRYNNVTYTVVGYDPGGLALGFTERFIQIPSNHVSKFTPLKA